MAPSVLGPLLFLIYINDLPDGITSICKIFADNYLFSKVLDINESKKKLNFDLEKTSEWAFQWKCILILIPINRLMKSYFLENQKSILIPLSLSTIMILRRPYQKHLGIILDSKLDFNIHVDNNIKKCYRMIGIIKRLSVSVPRKALLANYKSFVRLHLDYRDILYDKPGNQNFLNKFQYKACLEITGAIQGTSRQFFFDELGLHTLIERRWHGKLIFFYKIVSDLLSEYLYSYLKLPLQENYPLRSASTTKINLIPSRSKTFRKTFFPRCINE